MRHIRQIKDKVKSKLGGGSDFERLSSGTTPRTSTDSAKAGTRPGKPTGRRDLSKRDPPQNTSAVQTSSGPSPDHPPKPTPVTIQNAGWPDFKKSANGALRSILKIAAKASAPLPPLQSALDTVVASVEIYDVSRRRSTREIYHLTMFVDRNIAQTRVQSASSTDVFAP